MDRLADPVGSTLDFGCNVVGDYLNLDDVGQNVCRRHMETADILWMI